MSLMCSSLLLQQCSACVVHLTWIVFVISGRTAADLWGVVSRICSILLAALLCSCCQAIFSIHFFSIHVVHPYRSIDTIAALKNLRFILSVSSDLHMTDNLSIVVHAFACWYYLPTPPLGQDMTQGQFLSGVLQVSIQSFPSPRLVA